LPDSIRFTTAQAPAISSRLTWRAAEAFQHLPKQWQTARHGNHSETPPDEFAAKHVDMIAARDRGIVQAVRLTKDEMKPFRLKVRADGAAEKPVQLHEILIRCAVGIGENQYRMTTFFREWVVIDFPLPHREC